MPQITVDIRSAELRDAPGVTAVHDETWPLAYAGIIPAVHLSRMVQRRGPVWWADAIRQSRGGIMVLAVGDTIAGYATLGGARRAPPGPWTFEGEIYELYVKPEYQGLGFGTRLFRAARERLTAARRPRALVWALADNQPSVTFYRARGGKTIARDQERFGATALPKIAFGFGI